MRIRSILFLAAFSIQLLNVSFSQSWKPDASASKITFEIKNLGATVKGSFSGLEAEIFFDPLDLVKSDFSASINAASIDTDNNLRNKHLKEKTYFNTDAYPKIKFKSKKITATGENGKYIITGDLTVKGKTNEISFAFEFDQKGDRAFFKGSFCINRLNYNVGGSSWTMADNVVIYLDIAVVKTVK